MAVLRRIAVAFAVVAACLGADKKPPEGTVSNSAVEISAKLYTDKEDIKKILGSDLDGYFTLVDVRLAPKAGSKLAVTRDDFVLRSDKDGQRASPFHPSQIAGSGVLIVKTTDSGSASAEKGGPVWSPPLGGPPTRIGTGGTSIGNSAGGSQAVSSLDPESPASFPPVQAHPFTRADLLGQDRDSLARLAQC